MNKRTKGESLFPMWLFFVYLGVLLLMSGIHSGLLLGAGQWGWGGLLRTLSPILYWAAVAGGLTVFTRYRIRITYEEPMLRLADATRKVAKGDFSVYLAPIHTPPTKPIIWTRCSWTSTRWWRNWGALRP